MRIKNARELLEDNGDERKPLLEAYNYAINVLELNACKREVIGESKKYSMVDSNETACKAVIEYLTGADKKSSIYYLGPSVEGSVEAVAEDMAQFLVDVSKGKGEIKPPCYVVFGQKDMKVTLGEQVGYGGKTLEQALRVMLELKGNTRITAMFAKTNGTDGTTKAAGAIIDYTTFINSTRGINVDAYLKGSESRGILNQGKALILTGKLNVEKARICIAKII